MPAPLSMENHKVSKRTGLVTFKGDPLTLIGQEVNVGDLAPNVTLVCNDLSEVRLSDYRDKVVVLASVPSVDTPVCDTEVRRFNTEAAELWPEVQILVVSMDLPFAQQRWCGTAGIDQVQTLSDYRGAQFGKSYGVLIEELHLLARSVWVIDRSGYVIYKELVGELTEQPDYELILTTACSLIT